MNAKRIFRTPLFWLFIAVAIAFAMFSVDGSGGYARIDTNLGHLNIELLPEYAPRAVWNFVKLAQKGYYRNTIFHRNIKGFMIQGGDPTGTGRGGQSIWAKPFNDEFEGPNLHNARGILLSLIHI